MNYLQLKLQIYKENKNVVNIQVIKQIYALSLYYETMLFSGVLMLYDKCGDIDFRMLNCPCICSNKLSPKSMLFISRNLYTRSSPGQSKNTPEQPCEARFHTLEVDDIL